MSGRAVKALLFKHRVKLILLPGKMLLDLGEAIINIEPLIADHGILRKILDLFNNAAFLIVFLEVAGNRMILGQLRTAAIHDGTVDLENVGNPIQTAGFIAFFRADVLFNLGDLPGFQRLDFTLQLTLRFFKRNLVLVISLADSNRLF